MSRLLNLSVIARALGYSSDYLRKLAVDQGRPANERRFPEATHERFPQFIRDGNRRTYFVTEQSFNAFMTRRGRKWEVAL